MRAFEQVVKPAYGTGGLGLEVLADLSTVENGDVEEQSGLIVQQYISSPLLLNNRKFSVRLYVVSSTDVPQSSVFFRRYLCWLRITPHHRRKLWDLMT
jgi:hypothetical protein